ncbi:CubicO group peptidase (beta-lactamase class C family) [Ancylobacter aquaticus]|uniref:CubicO group peptidase (Beta-lactamase class C family) n=1 Tax=Ancylobacter aquaticus TaxID=100 RepID=A0A4R1I1E7_ANCAQ|nr:serine hydrolase [Ancylobacter aquaticus]TCK29007.1 CubicO group peptidase (beta-lactamase class C family) [Ancylobacter aquaticus]
MVKHVGQRPLSWLHITAAVLVSSVLAVPALSQTVPLTLGAIPPEDMVPLAKGGLEKALADLPAAVESVLKRSGVPGAAVVVVQGGKTVFARGFGVRELGKDAPVDTSTVFQIASMSKPIAATIAAIEVTAGKVSWDDPIEKHLPGFAVGDAYVTAHGTVGDYYSHRSGLPHAAGDTLEDIGFDRKTILERLRMLPLVAFRTSFNYSNFGFTTGAEAVAAAAGKTWHELAQQALYGPLGMTATSSRYADFLTRDNRATLHTLQDGHFVAGFTRDPDQQSPAGGVTSNVVDLAEWLKLLLADGERDGKTLISPAAMLPALRPQAFSSPARTIASRSGFYGFGFNVAVNANGRPDMSHSGAFVTGAATNVHILPSADLGIIVLTNAGPVGAPEAITGHFLDLLQFGEVTRDWYALMHPLLMQNYDPVGDLVGQTAPISPRPARPLAEYVGTYDSAYFGPATISQGESGLVLTLGPGAIKMPMTHWDGDTFSIAPRSENAPYGSLSSVQFKGQGKPETVRIDYLDDAGLAIWTR